MVVVRARDGTELVSLGPSYGKWLDYKDIPQVMREAMVSVEDKRFARTSASIRSAWPARSMSASVADG